MDQKKISVVVLLDMSKAFDSIRHDLMLRKLRKSGVSESACAWFEQRQNKDLTLPRYRLATGQKTFSYRGAKLYNSIAKVI